MFRKICRAVRGLVWPAVARQTQLSGPSHASTVNSASQENRLQNNLLQCSKIDVSVDQCQHLAVFEKSCRKVLTAARFQ